MKSVFILSLAICSLITQNNATPTKPKTLQLTSDAIEIYGNLRKCFAKSSGKVTKYLNDDGLGDAAKDVLLVITKRWKERTARHCS
ncbi:unnamed protein product [Heterobilharzia americana]|nr:unnamed protein product [Heterobilharzia americana]CAH8445302.1 unnamed protein product [Heterobilharzia americana]